MHSLQTIVSSERENRSFSPNTPTRQAETATHRNAIVVRPLELDQERQAAFRLRYEVFIEELSMPDKAADHQMRIIEEPWDDDALILGAFAGDELIGTVRVKFGDASGFGSYESMFQMEQFHPYFPLRVSFTNRFAVKPSYRMGRTAAKLCAGCFVHAQQRAVCLDFICCQPHLRSLYERLGYQQIHKDFDHAFGGRVSPMLINTCDPEHLVKCRSPFARHVDWSRRDPALIAFLDRLRRETGGDAPQL